MKSQIPMFTLSLIASCLVSSSSFADEAVEKSGQMRFEQYCAVCHGSGAKGDGPFAALLTKRPADLTTLAQRNKGEFPFGRAYDTIDGRNMLTAHGNREMPIWGKEMKDSGIGGETGFRGRLVETLIFLRSVQVK
jgi:mono/diheme cytochrome c family protein